MKQKQVKIIGLELKQNLGILKAHRLTFDENNKLIVFKGPVGAGKTTEQKALQLATQGSKTLTDKKLYGEVETEVQLLDGETNIWIGCKSDSKGRLIYTLYTKDENGKIAKDPIIDGVKATASKYLEALQTELTWKMDELTSENPVVQRDILLKLYQFELKKQGVIFDKKDHGYKDSILHKIELAEKERDYRDAKRKELGGIAEDLKEKGIDPDRPATVPDAIDLSTIEAEIKSVEKEKTIKEANAESEKNQQLAYIKQKASDLQNKMLLENQKLKANYDEEIKEFKTISNLNQENAKIRDEIIQKLGVLHQKEAIKSDFYKNMIESLTNEIQNNLKTCIEPNKPNYFDTENDSKIKELRLKYIEIQKSDFTPDLSNYDEKIAVLKSQKENAELNNKILAAVDSFCDWRDANEYVVKLKKEYVRLLRNVDTGVKGLHIVQEDDKIFLMYNGAFDPVYFNNRQKELRKLSSYSGTQKPMICLLLQSYLLSRKPKAMRYMYIDNVPMDSKTRQLIERMCNELNITVFLNITGDFAKDTLKNGEILIENGEVFFA